MSNFTQPNYMSGGPRPFKINHNGYCPDNELIFYIPEKDINGKKTEWKNILSAPTTIKHLYSEQPLNYEPIFMAQPQGTLYDHDYAKTYTTGIGKSKIIGGGHYKVWPLTNLHIKEDREYSNYYFERPDGYGFQNKGVGGYSYTSLTDAKLSNWF